MNAVRGTEGHGVRVGSSRFEKAHPRQTFSTKDIAKTNKFQAQHRDLSLPQFILQHTTSNCIAQTLP